VKSIVQVKVNLDKNCSEMHQVVSKDKALPKQTFPSTKYVWWSNAFRSAISVPFYLIFSPGCPYFWVQIDGSPGYTASWFARHSGIQQANAPDTVAKSVSLLLVFAFG